MQAQILIRNAKEIKQTRALVIFYTCIGIAATLYQFDPYRKLRVPIAFFSRMLSKAQFKYAIFDKEVLAIYESVKFF